MKKAFTLVEILVVLAITSVLALAVGAFSSNIISYNRTIFGSLDAAQNGRTVIKMISSELREAATSNTGIFAVSEASSTAITFFSDIDDDGIGEQIRYYLATSTLKKSVVKPTGNPLSYASWSTGTTTNVTPYVVNSSSTPIFEYFDASYDGATSSLAQPVNPQQIRLVKITILIEQDPNKAPVPIIFTTQVSLRNLKDNL